ncbi:MAG TPA: prolipoprotein diacylglyceryl transferase family protein [Bacteroidales bacterium]
MFPTLSHIIDYFFGVHITLPVPTFGFFVALAFVGAYQIFKSEFKRKEKLGYIHSFQKEKKTGMTVRILGYIFNTIVGFILGFKIIGIILDYATFAGSPVRYIFSLKGHMISGIIVGGIFIYLTYIKNRIDEFPIPALNPKEIHPYQLMSSIALWCGILGFVGAKLFSCLENPVLFIHHLARQLFSLTGWTFYGGLVFGALTYLYIGYRHGMRLIDLADIGSPGMMLAYGIGRMGCHLSGDGDWGMINSFPKPSVLTWLPDWAWSFQFPHNVLNKGIFIPNCAEAYCYALPQGVFPTSLYESVICLLLFAMLWLLRNKIRLPGLMFFLYLILAGMERFFMEMIKVNPHYHLGQLSFTQAEFISFFMIIGGIVGVTVLFFRNRSGRRMVNY